jgi:hypothetical protein
MPSALSPGGCNGVSCDPPQCTPLIIAAKTKVHKAFRALGAGTHT